MVKSVSLVGGIGDLKTTKTYYDNWSRKYDSTSIEYAQSNY